MLTPTSCVIMSASCSTIDPSPEPSSALISYCLGLICLTIDLLGVDVVILVGKLGRFSEEGTSELSSMGFVEVPDAHSTQSVGILPMTWIHCFKRGLLESGRP